MYGRNTYEEGGGRRRRRRLRLYPNLANKCFFWLFIAAGTARPIMSSPPFPSPQVSLFMSGTFDKLGIPNPADLEDKADKAYAQYVRTEMATVISVAVAVSGGGGAHGKGGKGREGREGREGEVVAQYRQDRQLA